MKKYMWVVTAWFADFEETGYTDAYEEFLFEDYEDAKRLQRKLAAEDLTYENVYISEEPELRDFYNSSPK